MTPAHEHHTPAKLNGQGLLDANLDYNYSYADSLEDEMAGTSRANNDEKLAEILETQNQLLMWLKTKELAGDNGKKGFQEKAAIWFPTLLTVLVLGFGAVRYDTTRETKASGDLIELRVRLEKAEKVNESLDSQLRAQERIWASLNGELEALKTVLKKGR